MSKQPIKESARTLLLLLDIARNLRGQKIEEKVEWPQVMQLAKNQCVRAFGDEAL